MKSIKTLSVCISLFIVGCKVTPEIPEYTQTRFDIPIKLLEFNSVAGHYVDKTAFVSLTTYAKNEYPETLTIEADGYGVNYNKYAGVTNNTIFVRFNKENTQVTIDAVNKYLDWQEQALKAGDMFTKEINATPKKESFGLETYDKYEFHSGNARNHFLIFSICSKSSLIGEQCTQRAALDRENAEKLKNIAQRYQEGELVKEDVASKYN